MMIRLLTRRALLPFVAVLLGATAPAPGGAQSVGRLDPWGAPSRTLEGFYTRYRLEPLGDRRVYVDGVGARLSWTLGRPLADPQHLAARSELGVFGVFTPDQDKLGYTTLHAGAEAMVRPLSTPLLGRIEPTLALGAGTFRTDVRAQSPADAVRGGLANRSNASFALSPGVGARVRLWQRLGVRGDVRDVLTFRDGVRHNVAVGLGLGLTL